MAILCVAACRTHCKGVIPFGNGHSGLDLCLAEKKIWNLEIEHPSLLKAGRPCLQALDLCIKAARLSYAEAVVGSTV
jgi:hypothetical protein